MGDISNSITGVSGPSSSEPSPVNILSGNAPGTGFDNVASGVGSILQSFSGIGMDIGQIINAAKADPNKLTNGINGNPYNNKSLAGNVPYTTILVIALIGFILWLVFKK